MPNKSIGFFNSSRTWGGGEKWHFDMAGGLRDREFHPVLIAGKKSDLFQRAKASGLTVHALKISNFSFLNPIKIYKIYRILKREGIRILIINLSEDVKAAGLAARLAGVKHILYRRGSAIPIRNSVSNRWIFKHLITGIIANSEQTKKTILQNNPDLFPGEKISVIYNGISLTDPPGQETPPLYPRRSGELLLGNAGRLVPQKGQHHLIRIARILKSRGLSFKLLIAGEGKLLEDLQQLAKEEGVFDVIFFLGFVPDIRWFMKSIDLFLLTSLWEGFGYVLVEAMAAGKPVIAFDVSSNPEIVENNLTGYLVPEGNIEGFADKIQYLAGNTTQQMEMGSKGRIRVESHFALETTLNALEQFLSRLSHG